MPIRFFNKVAYALLMIDNNVPFYKKSITNTFNEHWKQVMDEDIESIQKNKIGKLSQLARLVAKGHAQEEGIGYNELFSSMVKHSFIWILLDLVALLDLVLVQLDVKTTLLISDMEEEIYTTQPDGFKVIEKEN